MIVCSYHAFVPDPALAKWIKSHTDGAPPWWGFEVSDKEAIWALLKWGKYLEVIK